ncbi:MAG: protein kinase [Vicinamibacteria bacterium]|nr:protein kinase [Vicinamibacteria bacterium]
MSEPQSPTPETPAIKELSGRIGKYEIVKPLGKGAMGMVYLAHDTMLERDVALKVMVASIADDDELKRRFEREAKAVAKMTHPNVVMVFDLGYHTDGSPFLAMELLKGMDLQKAMRTPPPLSVERKCQIILQVLAGLAHAHQSGIVHRDIKPANIFIGQDGAVKIMDFGVARLTTASMTGTGSIVGTADYMSPEQVKGAKVDGRSDLFSVGCMLFELLANRRPFHSDNLMAIFYKITHEEPNWELIPEGPDYDALMPILQKALAKDLESRYATAYDFAVALREYLGRFSAAGAGVEELVDLGGPPDTAAAITALEDLVGDGTEITAQTMDVGPGATPSAPTVGAGAPTVRGSGRHAAPGAGTGRQATLGAGTGRVPTAPTRVVSSGAPAAAAARAAAPAPPASGTPTLYVVLGGLGVAVLALGAYILFGRTETPAPPATVVQAPPSTAPPATAPPTTQPAPTPAPAPTFAEAVGKGAASLRAAQSAFKAGDYDTAMSKAQAALKEDPQNADAKRIVDNALQGQKAAARFAAAEAALRQGDHDRAMTEADAGRALAPWDARVTGLVTRIQTAQSQAQAAEAQKKQAAHQQQLNALLTQAQGEITAGKYDAAIALYDEALKLDPSSQAAMIGKTSAVSARALAQASAGSGASRPAAAKAFEIGKTVASAGTGGAVPPGFSETVGVQAVKGSATADLPGKLEFEVSPSTPKPGEKYTVRVVFGNDGGAPIQIKDMIVTTVINGKRSQGPVPPSVKEVAPRDKAVIFQNPDFWKEDWTAWSMEVLVRTVRGESYKNKVTWSQQ